MFHKLWDWLNVRHSDTCHRDICKHTNLIFFHYVSKWMIINLWINWINKKKKKGLTLLFNLNFYSLTTFPWLRVLCVEGCFAEENVNVKSGLFSFCFQWNPYRAHWSAAIFKVSDICNMELKMNCFHRLKAINQLHSDHQGNQTRLDPNGTTGSLHQ